jgi:AraC-like DNA-binding protein
MVPIVTSVFQALRVSASLYDGRNWWSIHSAPSFVPFEVEHGVEEERWKYNERSFAGVRSRKASLLGEHAGHHDLFVPLLVGNDIVAVLVVGSFVIARPTSIEIAGGWRSMTGRQAHPADPEFSAYMRAKLSMLVLDAGKVKAFQRLLECLGKLLTSNGPADELANEAHAQRLELEPTRFTERVWEVVGRMVDERSSEGHHSIAVAYELRRLGVERAPDHVLVGLARARNLEIDPVEEIVVRDAFQRSVVELARSAGDTIAGRVGESGVVFLSAMRGSASSKKQGILSLAEKAGALARRFGLELYLGTSLEAKARPLSRRYYDALAAAESALTSRKKLVVWNATSTTRSGSLRGLREELGRVIEEDPRSLAAKFDGYLEAVAVRTGYRVEAARTEIELFFERTADALLRNGALDPKSFYAMRDALDRVAPDVTMPSLFAAYRRAIAELSQAVENPVVARQDRGLRGALAYIHQHYGEPLALVNVARVAGFAPKYFSELFRRRQEITFEAYVMRLRLERAKHLLSGTDLSAKRIAELAGFRTPQYLCRVFRRVRRESPLEYREARRPEWRDKRPSQGRSSPRRAQSGGAKTKRA